MDAVGLVEGFDLADALEEEGDEDGFLGGFAEVGLEAGLLLAALGSVTRIAVLGGLGLSRFVVIRRWRF